jgi:hypothetical protein
MMKGLYKHYKGGLYVVFGFVRHHEDGYPMVLYYSLEKDTINVRPLNPMPGDSDCFLDVVDFNDGIVKGKINRFTWVRDDNALVSLALNRLVLTRAPPPEIKTESPETSLSESSAQSQEPHPRSG